jgi:transglutaminase-like putative cysteine protease
MRLAITHETRYRYNPAVQTAQHVAHLQPSNTPGQKVLSHRLHIEPDARVQHHIDAFLNHRAYWALTNPHDGLLVRAESQIETTPVPTAPAPQSWESVRAHFRYRGGQPGDVHSGLVFGSHHAPVHEAFLAYAQPSFTPGRPLMQAAQELTARMHRDFRYEAQSTDINTPALQALQERRGVCQDFAHILLACLRSLGLPARYVSGYLLTQPPPAGAGHRASPGWWAATPHTPGPRCICPNWPATPAKAGWTWTPPTTAQAWPAPAWTTRNWPWAVTLPMSRPCAACCKAVARTRWTWRSPWHPWKTTAETTTHLHGWAAGSPSDGVPQLT